MRGGLGLQMVCRKEREEYYRVLPQPPASTVSAPNLGPQRTLYHCKGTGGDVLAFHPYLPNYRELSLDAHGLLHGHCCSNNRELSPGTICSGSIWLWIFLILTGLGGGDW